MIFVFCMYFLGASSCDRCPEGHYCTSGSTAELCPAGYYCPEGTGYDIQPCPVGTFGGRTGLVTVDQCTKCTSGYYCQFSGKSNVTGPCDGGKNLLKIEIGGKMFLYLKCFCFHCLNDAW